MPLSKDRFQKNSLNNQIYSDFLNDLTPHPVVKDIVRYTNEAAVNRSIRNLIMTNKGERLYQPKIGSDIMKLLFEPMDTSIAELLSTSVTSLIDQYEPRAKVLRVETIGVEDKNAYVINVYYMLINKEDPVQLTVTLSRVR